MLNEHHNKFTKLSGLMKKFKFSSDGNESEDRKESQNNEEFGSKFVLQFNDENLIKSVELQENIANSILTSSYYTLRLN